MRDQVQTHASTSVADFIRRLLQDDFPPRGDDMAWLPEIVWVHVVSDAALALAFYAISVGVLIAVYKRRELAFSRWFVLLAGTLLAGATTHVFDLFAIWHPIYRLDGVIKAIAALVSVATAVVLWRWMPSSAALPSSGQLRDAHELLAAQTQHTRVASEEMQRSRDDLEHRVRESPRAPDRDETALAAALRGSGVTAFHQDRGLRYTWVFSPERGRMAADMLGRTDIELFGEQDGGRMHDLKRQVLASGKRFRGEVQIGSDDSAIWYDMALDPVCSETGVVIGLRGVAIDANEQHLTAQAEAIRTDQRRQAQKMESLGRLAGGIAHDFNNLLSVLLSFADISLEELPPDHPVRGNLIEMRRAAERASALTAKLLAFSRRQVLEPTRVKLDDTVAEVGELLQRLIGDDVRLELRSNAPGIYVDTDPSQLQNALFNLAANARDAMPGGGTLFVETSTHELDAAGVQRLASPDQFVQPGRYALLTVRDIGTGMTPEVKRHLFEPFFTTKPPGSGTGLGLAAVFGFVRQSGGLIEVITAPGKGTTFSLFLPIASPPTLPAPAPAPEVKTPEQGHERILVVEDEVSLRALVERLLRGAGYDVTTAIHAEDALVKAAGMPHIDLLLTDIVMGPMNGVNLARQLEAQRPGLRVLFMSGYPSEIDRAVLQELHDRFLQKPFRPAELLQRVRTVLDRHPSA